LNQELVSARILTVFGSLARWTASAAVRVAKNAFQTRTHVQEQNAEQGMWIFLTVPALSTEGIEKILFLSKESLKAVCPALQVRAVISVSTI